jgi:hypothetical protein
LKVVAADPTQSTAHRLHRRPALSLAFLSTDLTKEILQGEQPRSLRLAYLLDGDIPLSWDQQRAMINRLAAGWHRPSPYS